MRKVILSLTLALAITGCGLFPQVYDNNEYQLLAQLETSVQLIDENCSDPDRVRDYMPRLVYDATLLHTYTFYIPANTEVYGMADILKKDVREFEAKYKNGEPKPVYCKLKSKLFLKKVRRALEAVAKKKRI